MTANEEETYTYLFKVVLIGDSGVGKLSLRRLSILFSVCLSSITETTNGTNLLFG